MIDRHYSVIDADDDAWKIHLGKYSNGNCECQIDGDNGEGNNDEDKGFRETRKPELRCRNWSKLPGILNGCDLVERIHTSAPFFFHILVLLFFVDWGSCFNLYLSFIGETVNTGFYYSLSELEAADYLD